MAISEPTDAVTPVLFLIDSSGFSDKQIDSLLKGLNFFKNNVHDDSIEIAIISFSDSVTIEQDFTPLNSWEPPSMGTNINSGSPIGEAIERAAELARDRREKIINGGLTYRRSQICIIASNRPTDLDVGGERWDEIQEILETFQSHRTVEFIISGISGSRLDLLNELVSETDIPLLHIYGDSDLFHDYFQLICEVVPNRAKAKYEWDQQIDVIIPPDSPVTFRRPIETFDIITDSDTLSLY